MLQCPCKLCVLLSQLLPCGAGSSLSQQHWRPAAPQGRLETAVSGPPPPDYWDACDRPGSDLPDCLLRAGPIIRRHLQLLLLESPASILRAKKHVASAPFSSGPWNGHAACGTDVNLGSFVAEQELLLLAPLRHPL